MERLLRGVISVGGYPENEEGFVNWRRLFESELEFNNEEDAKIFKYLKDYYYHYDCPPDISLLNKFFEEDDQIEVRTRLDEISRCQLFIRQNYKSIIDNTIEKQRIKACVIAHRDAMAIAEHGRKVGKEIMRGVDASNDFFDVERAKIRSTNGFAYRNASMIKSNRVTPKFLMKHFGLKVGRPSALVAYAGSAKTFLAIELAIAVAAGLDSVWGGVPIELKGKVIHLDYEMGENDLDSRYQRVAFGLDVDLDDLQESLEVVNLPKDNLCTPGIEERLNRDCRGKALLIIDSFRAAIAGSKIEENSSEVRKYIDMLNRISNKTGCVVLMLHHERKTGKDNNVTMKLQAMRGSSGLADAFGATIHVEKSTNGFQIMQGKVSSTKAGDVITFCLQDVGNNSEGIEIVQAMSAEQDSQLELDIKFVIKVLSEHKGYIENKETLKKYCVGIRYSRVVDAVHKMKERGILKDTRFGYKLNELPTLTVEDMIN